MIEQETVKQCCARLYESDFAKLLLGDSFHPGGLKLTERLGELLKLGPHSRVLDVASGKGTSALFLAERFGSEVVGIDYSSQNVGDCFTTERPFSRERFVHYTPERPDIRTLVHSLSACLLWAHIGGSAHHHAPTRPVHRHRR